MRNNPTITTHKIRRMGMLIIMLAIPALVRAAKNEVERMDQTSDKPQPIFVTETNQRHTEKSTQKVTKKTKNHKSKLNKKNQQKRKTQARRPTPKLQKHVVRHKKTKRTMLTPKKTIGTKSSARSVRRVKTPSKLTKKAAAPIKKVKKIRPHKKLSIPPKKAVAHVKKGAQAFKMPRFSDDMSPQTLTSNISQIIDAHDRNAISETAFEGALDQYNSSIEHKRAAVIGTQLGQERVHVVSTAKKKARA